MSESNQPTLPNKGDIVRFVLDENAANAINLKLAESDEITQKDLENLAVGAGSIVDASVTGCNLKRNVDPSIGDGDNVYWILGPWSSKCHLSVSIPPIGEVYRIDNVPVVKSKDEAKPGTCFSDWVIEVINEHKRETRPEDFKVVMGEPVVRLPSQMALFDAVVPEHALHNLDAALDELEDGVERFKVGSAESYIAGGVPAEYFRPGAELAPPLERSGTPFLIPDEEDKMQAHFDELIFGPKTIKLLKEASEADEDDVIPMYDDLKFDSVEDLVGELFGLALDIDLKTNTIRKSRFLFDPGDIRGFASNLILCAGELDDESFKELRPSITGPASVTTSTVVAMYQEQDELVPESAA